VLLIKSINNKKIIQDLFIEGTLNIRDTFVDTSSSIINSKVMKSFGKNIFSYRVDDIKNQKEVDIIVKYKSDKIIQKGNFVTNPFRDKVMSKLYKEYNYVFGFDNSFKREMLIYENISKNVSKFIPKTYNTIINEAKREYVVVMEKFKDKDFRVFNSFEDYIWEKEDIKIVLRDIARIHSEYLNNYDSIKKSAYLNIIDGDFYKDAKEYLLYTLNKTNREYPQYISQHHKLITNFITNIEKNLKVLDTYPKTLSHNDFNPRNLNITNNNELLLFDWELACIQSPQHDVAEFFIFLINNEFKKDEMDEFLIYYKTCLERYSNITLDDDLFMHVFKICLLDLMINRLNLYLLSNKILRFKFIKKVYKNINKLISIYINENDFN
ncbi:MAG: phosphotransferase, partial [Romboutsia sp.]|nr:phosphotransferase [Romboutsia sp.]